MTEQHLPLIAAGGALLAALIGFLVGRYALPYQSRAARDQIAQLRGQISRLESSVTAISAERGRIIAERDTAAGRAIEAEARLAAFSERDRLLRERLERDAAQSQKVISTAKAEFEDLANRLMRLMADSISETSGRRVAEIIEPLGTRLAEFRERIESLYGSEVRDRYALQKEIRGVAEASHLLSRQTDDLAKVLRVESRVQGRWGEVVLERILEHSGLKPDVMFFRREHKETRPKNDSKPTPPDAVIVLPGNKHILIDVQAPLGAYDSYANAETAEARDSALADLTRGLRAHVNRLAATDYTCFEGLHPHELSLMFVPAEGALAAAFSIDAGLFTYAWDKGVIIASPTSLMMTLRTIAELWRSEIQHQNVVAIAEHADALHDEICAFLDDMQRLGASVEVAQAAYKRALEKLSSGPGNILEHSKALHELGTGSRRQMPQLEVRLTGTSERGLTNGPMEQGKSLDSDSDHASLADEEAPPAPYEQAKR